MGKGIEFIGEVAEAGIPSLVFGGGTGTGSAGCANGGGALGAVIGGGRHKDWAAGDDLSNSMGCGCGRSNGLKLRSGSTTFLVYS